MSSQGPTKSLDDLDISYHWVTEAEELRSLIFKWQQCSYLYLDTEFHRENTFYPILALVQVADNDNVYLIEPEIIEAVPEFLGVLSDGEVEIVMHSASEDCEVLFRRFNRKLNRLFDTQVACGFLYGKQIKQHPSSVGFAAMVALLLDTEINKDQSRSDWLQRPLTKAQEVYAAADVYYLRGCHQKIVNDLTNNRSLVSWIEQDSQAIAERVAGLDDIDYAYLDIKNAYLLDELGLTRLDALVKWRELIARKKDKPKNFILRNEILFQIAEQGLVNNKLPFIDRWHPASRRRYSADIQSLLENIQASKVFNYKPIAPKFWQKRTKLVQGLIDKINVIANELDIASEVLVSRKLLRQYIAFQEDAAPFQPISWTKNREQALGDMILSTLNNY